jgi:hypothetical protein
MSRPPNSEGGPPEGRPAAQHAAPAAAKRPEGSSIFSRLQATAWALASVPRPMSFGVGDVPRFLQPVLAELDAAERDGRVRRCRHLRGGMAVLLPWEPRRLRCGPCADEALARVAGTPEDNLCDACRQPAGAGRMHSAVYTLRGGTLLVRCGVCTACLLSGQVS